MKSLLAAVCIALLMPAVPAPAQTDPAQVSISVGPPGGQTGKDFVEYMMMCNKYEIDTGQLALERSRDPAVQGYARGMVQAHRTLSEDMKAVTDRIAVGRLVTPPPAFDPRHQPMYEALDHLSGPAFDRIFIAQQIAAHRGALAYADGYARRGGIRQIRDFAGRTVPVIRDHLAMAQKPGGAAMALN